MKLPFFSSKAERPVEPLVDRESLAEIARLRDKIAKQEAAIAGFRKTYVGRVRIGFKPLSPMDLTAQVRPIESSLVVDYDGSFIVVTGQRELTEAEYNQLVSILGFELNRT